MLDRLWQAVGLTPRQTLGMWAAIAVEPVRPGLAAMLAKVGAQVGAQVGVRVGLAAGWLAEALSPRMAMSAPRTLAYGPDPRQALDLWHPGDEERAAQRARLLLYIHGGGWCGGSRRHATGRAKIAWTLARGHAFATMDYRLVPAVRVEDQVADVAAALAHLLARAPALGLDPARVVVMGHSAGAHLAALVATDPRWLGAHGLAPAHLAGVVLIDGAAYDVPGQLAETPALLRPLYRQAFGDDPARQRGLSPVHAVGGAPLPRFLLLHCHRRDGLAQAWRLVAALHAAGGAADLMLLPGRGLAGHVAANRRLGRPDWPGTAALAAWLR